ncbi:excisionase family DNA binding protein [Maritimibacter alkaliphilus HTCC2654]|uniref:helix-turn-helix domain-containing protein n=1 Tax=Maritimibacter alkaliphilus TaxID=404236 RepID=UPI00032507E4|nr:helix-turn-helix domain-containing protein [Maritimibacter alkaliphilus]TYP84389.1 excisionase family DNA binding protein [Maritimibacter alkaliphilus HTCC2654]
MAKKFPAQRIKGHRVYDVWEVAQALDCHKQTVIRWIKAGELSADTSRKPWLIEGKDLKAFLGARQTKITVKLAPHHCYCLGCKAPREPDGKMADYTQQTPETGRLTGLCPKCGSLMHKVVRRVDLEAIRAKIEVTVQKASPRIVSRADPRSNVTIEQKGQTHGKTQQG